MITRAKISAVRASGVRRLFEGGVYSSKYGKPLSFNIWVLSATCRRYIMLYFQGQVIDISAKMINSKLKILEKALANSLRLENTTDIMQTKVY